MMALNSADDDWECEKEREEGAGGKEEAHPSCSTSSMVRAKSEEETSRRLLLSQLSEVPTRPSNPTTPPRILEPLQEALYAIPAADKRSYDVAVQRCPRLIEWESPPERYLRFDNYDAKAAALRLVDYWQARLELYGPERAYMPLTLSGTGALNEEDLAVLKTGIYMVLPDDSFGRPVIFQDKARLTTPEVMDQDRVMRCLFYVLSIVSERENIVETGMTMLNVTCDKIRKSALDVPMLQKAASLFAIRKVIPLRMVSSHHVLLSNRQALSCVLPQYRRVFDGLGERKPKSMSYHQNKPLDELHVDLRKHGFHLEGLPKVPLDGLFTFGCFRKWMEDRARLEKKRYKHWKVDNNEEGSGNDGNGGSEEGNGNDDDDDANSTSTNPEEEATRKRRALEAAYARRKRARKRIERRVHETEIERLVVQRDALRNEGRELEGLLQEATRLVRNHEEEEKEEQQRRMMLSLCEASASILRGLSHEAMPYDSLAALSQNFLSHQPRDTPRTFLPLDHAAQPGNNVLAALLMERTASVATGATVSCDPHSILSRPSLSLPREDTAAGEAPDALIRRVITGMSPSDSRLLSLLLTERQARRQREATTTTSLIPQQQQRPAPPSPLADDQSILRLLAMHGSAGRATPTASDPVRWDHDDLLGRPPPAFPAFLASSASASSLALAATSVGSLLSNPEQSYRHRLQHAQDLQQQARFQELYELMSGNAHGGHR